MLAAEPAPTAWNPARYSLPSPDAPPQAGSSAPPPSGPAPSSDRSDTSAITVSAVNSRTPGLVRIRWASPESVSSESSSDGSSDAWCAPTASARDDDGDSVAAANSASLRSDLPRGTCDRSAP